MPTFNNIGQTSIYFFFNHVITQFSVLQAIVMDHRKHFCNHMMSELTAKLGLSHESSTLYYHQDNGKVEAINKVLKTLLQHMIGVHRSDWQFILYASLWAYRSSINTATRFTPFQLVYVLEEILPIECDIPSLKLLVKLIPSTFVEEERLLLLTRLDETLRDVSMVNEAYKKHVKAQYDKSFKPRVFSEGYLFLLYDQEFHKL